ncbi:MAG: hypothetical protein DCF19_04875 [Pseudanabaena frigida]|uniref:Uncharacterized protein n=1 Tax=Pseudanabaena frigida TaxID=945775 RepID=A0A2W4WJB2_9CYAN|nr:MAG: hypothetical protein DCF19_04875 [Pseudanabaena frigida]
MQFNLINPMFQSFFTRILSPYTLLGILFILHDYAIWNHARANAQPTSSSQQILSGNYAIGGTGMALVVRGNQYYYSDEIGQTEWKPTSQLNYINEGVVFGEGYYWCLRTLPGPRGVCTRHGWMRDISTEDIQRCSDALTATQDRIRQTKNVLSLKMITIQVSDRYPDRPSDRPDGYQFLMVGKGGFDILASEQLMASISTQIITNCPSVSMVEFATYPEGAGIYGLVNNKVQGFDCYEAYNTLQSPNPKPPWGYEGCL